MFFKIHSELLYTKETKQKLKAIMSVPKLLFYWLLQSYKEAILFRDKINQNVCEIKQNGQ